MDNAKKLGVKFNNANRMRELTSVVFGHFWKNKKLTKATIEDLPKLRSAYTEMEQVFKYGELPDF